MRPIFNHDMKERFLSFLARYGRIIVLLLPLLWIVLFFLLPFLHTLYISLAQADLSAPPYQDIMQWTKEGVLSLKFYVQNYFYIFTQELHRTAFLNSLHLAFMTMLVSLLLGYPIALAISKAPPSKKLILLAMMMLPFWVSLLIRVYAMVVIGGKYGVINNLLIHFGLIVEPLQLLQSNFMVYVGTVYSYLPFMIVPIYLSLDKIEHSIFEAAYDLGCRSWQVFLRITLPLSAHGVRDGCLLVFVPVLGEYVIPELLGQGDMAVLGKTLWNEFFINKDWPVASAIAVTLVLIFLLPIVLLQSLGRKKEV